MSRQSVITLDRTTCASRPIMIETVSGYIEKGAVVQIEDSSRPRSMKQCYEIRSGEAALQLGAHGPASRSESSPTLRPLSTTRRFMTK